MRILVVEDDPDLLQSLAASFREEGYAVDSSNNGSNGLYLALSAEYDVIILDVLLPGIDGWEFVARLREKKQTPVVMLTARASVQDKVRGLDGGADDYLTKPFDLSELFARVRVLIRRKAGQAQALIVINDVTIDTPSRSIYLRKEPVALTAREYSLVEYLALHRGRVVSRTELYEHLFDESEDSLSNLLDVHVSNIRRKLGHDLIQTRRGHGYLIP